jgi:aryl-alcohol dehydrogenase-like predicted oxidoreductase
MEYRPLGTSELRVSVIGYGASSVNGWAFPQVGRGV